MNQDNLLERIAQGDVLTAEELIEVMKAPFAQKALTDYITDNHEYSEFSHYLRGQAELYLLDQPYAEEILKIYIERDFSLSDAAEVKLLDQPYAEEILKIYLANRDFPLADAAQVKLLDKPYAPEILKLYIEQNASLCEEAEVKLLTKPYAKELVLLLLKDGYYSRETEVFAQEKGWIA
ncbi:MAG: hypothetical protein J6B00_01350 [Alphaproteobacteria bacterium]|nr:hypothetical protein [Alphaproteobacteria bacterium]